jgi:hypothetical protein
MRLAPGNDLNLGILPGRDASLQFPRTARDKHLYVCGGIRGEMAAGKRPPRVDRAASKKHN